MGEKRGKTPAAYPMCASFFREKTKGARQEAEDVEPSKYFAKRNANVFIAKRESDFCAWEEKTFGFGKRNKSSHSQLNKKSIGEKNLAKNGLEGTRIATSTKEERLL